MHIPGGRFGGRVVYVYPLAERDDENQRGAFQLANPGGRLSRPGCAATSK
jgi:hypothetical protein